MRPLKYAIPFLIIVSAAAAFAVADADPVSHEDSGKADPADVGKPVAAPSGVADLEVNRAELEQGLEQGVPTDKVERTRVPSPLMAAIDATMEESRVRIVVLRADLAKQADPDAIMALQHQIEQVKVETELDILRIQADHARKSGDEELARSIDEAIVFMTTPRPVVAPVERPAPDAGRR